MPVKTENQIWVELIDLFKTALTQRGISGFTVRQGNQPVKVTDTKPLVLLHKLSEVPVGSQFRHDFVDDDDLLQHEEGYLIELTYQVNAVKRRDVNNDTTATQTATDAIQALRAWLMSSKGYMAFKAKGYGLMAVKTLRPSYSLTESDDFELSSNFDFTVCIKQSYLEPQPEIMDKTFTIIRI